MTTPADHRPLRQWRVTITEDGTYQQLTTLLSWRTFPCRADAWDGHATFEHPRLEHLPIVSQEALREVLGQLAAEPWTPGVRRKYKRP